MLWKVPESPINRQIWSFVKSNILMHHLYPVVMKLIKCFSRKLSHLMICQSCTFWIAATVYWKKLQKSNHSITFFNTFKPNAFWTIFGGDETNSVTRLGYFWKVLASNFPKIVAQIRIGVTNWAILKNVTKNYFLANIWKKLGSILFQHLVTLGRWFVLLLLQQIEQPKSFF